MQGYKASYILNKPEILFLLSSVSDIQPSFPAKYVLSEYLSNCIVSQDAVEGLVYKGLVSKNAGRITVEQVVNLLVLSVLTSNKLWIVDCDSKLPMLIFRSQKMFLCAQHYQFIDGSWKITPYQSSKKIISEIEHISITNIMAVDTKENQDVIMMQSDFSWLED